MYFIFLFKQKTAYEMRISDGSSDVCSSDLQELSKIEKPAGVANPKDFRNEVVKFALRARAQNDGRNPSWTSYEKLREVIEKRMFSQIEDLLPVISFGTKKDGETDRKHHEFVTRLVRRGYTERQVRRLVEWYMRVNKAG